MPIDPTSLFATNLDAAAVRLATALAADEITQQILATKNLLDGAQYNIRTGQRDNAMLQLELAKARIEKAMAQLQR